ncbi:hypothetical protein Tco_0920537, partial [Tanacetum coccineum]
MEAAVEQCSIDKKCFEIQKKELLLENDRLLELIISQDLMHTVVNSLEVIDECESMRKSWCEEYNRNLTLETELSKMNELSKTCSRLQNHCISLELKLQQNKESFQNNRSCNNQDAPALNEFFVINDLKAQLQAKEFSISKLRAHIATLKGKNVGTLITSTSASGSQSKNNTRKNRITPAASSNKKNKTVEALPRKVMSSLNKKNHVSLCNANFKHDVKDANSKSRVKSKSSKSKKMEWKPTGKVFTSVGHRSTKSSS